MRNRPTKESLAEIPELDITKAKIVGRGTKVGRRFDLRSLRAAFDKTQLTEYVGLLPRRSLDLVLAGIDIVLGR